MFDTLLELVGKYCEITTSVEDYYTGIVKRVEGNVLVVFDEYEEKDIYVNLFHLVHAEVCDDKTQKPKKLRLFSKKDSLEDM